MLYTTFEKIRNEGQEANSGLNIDKNQHMAHYRLNIGNILEIELSLQFFAPANDFGAPDDADMHSSPQLIKPEIFKQLL